MALAYIAAERDCSISYRDRSEESRRNTAIKRKNQRAGKLTVSDSNALYGPPDKTSNFGTSNKKRSQNLSHNSHGSESDDDLTDLLPTKKKKQATTSGSAFQGIGQRVEVKYDDNIWYKGTLMSFDIGSGAWTVAFEDDEETTVVNFPDKDVRLIN